MANNYPPKEWGVLRKGRLPSRRPAPSRNFVENAVAVFLEEGGKIEKLASTGSDSVNVLYVRAGNHKSHLLS